MDISLKEISIESRHILENLFPYYIYDMSEYMGWTPDDNGLFKYDSSNFDVYWQQDDHVPYFIYVGNELAGFVLVRKYPGNNTIYDIAQFFILRKFKGKGIGKSVLALIVKHFPGKWQIRVLIENSGALQFWQSAISNLVGDDYKQRKDLDIDLLMHFLTFEV